MSEERRAAPRYQVPADVTADVSGVAVRLLDLSAVGARVEHEERFPLATPDLTIRWKEMTVRVPVRVARSEIVGRRGAKLLYDTGLTIVSSDSLSQGVIAAILRDPDATPLARPMEASVPQPPDPEPPAAKPLLDDSWTRQVRFLRHEDEEELPYAQFRLTAEGWRKEYVATPEQPADGFTIERERRDFDELQRTFEAADPETCRMMQIALESQMKRR